MTMTDNNGIEAAGADEGTDKAASVTVADAPVTSSKSIATPPPSPSREKKRSGPIRRFFRSLFSHLVFAGVVAAAVVGYLNHRAILGKIGDELCSSDRLGGFMTKPQAAATEPASIAVEKSAAASGAGDSAVETSDATAETPAAAESQSETDTVPEAAASATSGAESGDSAAPAPATNSTTEMAATEPAPAKGEMPEIAPGAAPGASADAPNAEGDAAASSQSALVRGWEAARKAYSAREPEAAEDYRKLVEAYPDIVALHGEYGNVLYGLGRTKEASDQYYQAALLHLKGPQPGMASCLADVIARIDPARAEELKAKTTEPCPYRQK